MDIELVEKPIKNSELAAITAKLHWDFVKGVVDVESRIMAIGARMHADEEAFLLEKGSDQSNLWGINLYPDKLGQTDYIEFDSMINIRPDQNNRGRYVEDKETQAKIVSVVMSLVKP